MIKKTEIFMLIFVVLGAIGIAWGFHTVNNTIQQDGLKTIIDSIWCGKKGCND